MEDQTDQSKNAALKSTSDLTIPEVLAEALNKLLEARTLSVDKQNAELLRFWKSAVFLEAAFIGAVLLLGFGACVALAFAPGGLATAEKIAFALFGFIGGRGFMHIRALSESPGKKG
ncbi:MULTISPECIES: hypothetical protein [unclassified Caballeronia]|uniref:hypothetical protein n=1 Tax=unclassified Caballeronia TaxID=2646786 RepID=UPI002027F9D5|nr:MULTISPECIES: hypothetical protein [unclassified Caballeronia]